MLLELVEWEEFLEDEIHGIPIGGRIETSGIGWNEYCGSWSCDIHTEVVAEESEGIITVQCCCKEKPEPIRQISRIQTNFLAGFSFVAAVKLKLVSFEAFQSVESTPHWKVKAVYTYYVH